MKQNDDVIVSVVCAFFQIEFSLLVYRDGSPVASILLPEPFFECLILFFALF